jgi:lipoyl(octanoyl) transferase
VVCHLLGLVDFESCLALQHRLVYEASGSASGQITILFCEHPALVTVGRQGSRADVHWDAGELARRGLDLRWVNRGGGAILHAPGQLAVYPIVPLEFYGLSVGEYVQHLENALSSALTEEGFQLSSTKAPRGIAGRTGTLASLGVAVRNWVSYFGAYINVTPSMQLVRRVDVGGERRAPMSCLAAERQQPVRMPSVRERVARHLAAEFGCNRYHVYTGHPLLVPSRRLRENAARAG